MSETQTLTEELVLEQLTAVEDPEIHLSIVGLGLIYKVTFPQAGAVKVAMTLTSPGCPYGPMIIDMTKAALHALDGVQEAEVEVVWSPPWDPKTMASDDVKAELGIWD